MSSVYKTGNLTELHSSLGKRLEVLATATEVLFFFFHWAGMAGICLHCFTLETPA